MIHDPTHIFVADFGQPVVLHTRAGDREITAIWDAGFFDSSVGETVMDTTQKRLTARACELCDLRREDLLTVNGEKFKVNEIQPDGTGFATITLKAEDD